MAVAKESTYDTLKRAPSYSGSYTVSLSGDSTISIEDLGSLDIDAIVNKRWVLDEVIGQLQSRLAILSGGRDRRGGPIITLYATQAADLRPSNVGKILSYLSKIPDESVQGLGFTIILDAQHVSWQVTKHAMKSLQMTFVEHIHQLLIVKPRAFWQRHKTGVNLTLKKARYGFPVIMLESSSDLFQHLQVSQVTSDLGGTIRFNHQEWIDTQRVLEKHLIQLLNRLDGFEHVREQLELQERPSSLIESRDSVRRHVDAQDIIAKEDLDCECEAVSHSIGKLRPCSNPDFIACFGRLEEMCSCLHSMQAQLQRMWDEKGARLDQVVQLRKYEHDSNQMMQWIEDTVQSLSQKHTDIGDSVSSAEINKQAFHSFQSQIANQYQEISRVISVGERLIAARHYALDVMQVGNKRLKTNWEKFSTIVEERNNMFELSVVFHDWQQKFFMNIDVWSEACSSRLIPSNVMQCQEALAQHRALQERYQLMYTTTRTEGHRLIEKLKKPVGESSVPSNFVMCTRNVKELLENLYDEFNWLGDQWTQRNTALQRALTYNVFLDETKKVYSWLSERGWAFIVSNAYLGDNAGGAQALIKQHDAFEAEAKEIYSTSLQLFERARQLAVNGECDQEPLEGESRKLEMAVHTFAGILDERRDLLVQACTFYCNQQMLMTELDNLVQPVPRDQFNGLPTTLEKRQLEFQSKTMKVDELATQCFEHGEALGTQLEVIMRSSKEAGHTIGYTNALRSVQQVLGELREEKVRVDEICERRHARWTLSLHLDQLQKDAEKHLTSVELWCTEKREEEERWRPSDNTLDAQQQLDAIQTQHDQLIDTHNDLLTRGKGISAETEQLDAVMFGSAHGPAHPVTVTVSQLETRITEARQALDGIASSLLSKSRQCLSFHLLRHRCDSLTSALGTLTSSTTQLPPIGHSLPSASSALQRHTENNQRLEALCKDVDVFVEQVDGCADHYESARLTQLARSLQEKKTNASRSVGERLRLAKNGLSFYKGVEKLGTIMDKCRNHFKSSDIPLSVPDSERLLSTLHELKDLVEQATGSVQSQGKQLVDYLTTIPTTGSSSPGTPWKKSRSRGSPILDTRSMSVQDDFSDLDCGGKRRPRPPTGRHSTTNLIEEMDIYEGDESSEEGGRGDSPHLLVTPRKTRPGLKSYQSSPVSLALSPDQIMIETQLYKVGQELQGLIQFWEHRKTQLETSRRVIEFREAVPQVASWLETRGTELLKNKNNFGRSREEVLQFMSEHDGSDDQEVAEMKEKVESLLESYRIVEGCGHRDLNHIRGVASTLEMSWMRFYSELEQRHRNLHLSLEFQEMLFEGSNWVQKSRVFLDTLTQRTESVDRSEEAEKLINELSLYFSCTVQEQTDRVTEAKHISAKLHSNVLVEQAAQIDQSTQGAIRDLEACRQELERLHEKLVQIEGEKDRVRQLIKQRERVLEEMLQTEETYVADLKLIEKCRPRFVSEVLPNTLKGKEDIIFSNIQDVDALHRLQLLPQLRDRATDTEGAARVFIEFADTMTGVYVPYCKNKRASEDLLASHRTYLSRMQSMFGLQMPLSSLLIKPIQRITKYPLLLKDAIKYTSQLGQPTAILEEALGAVEGVLAETNNAIHLSHLQNFEEHEGTVGRLFFQGGFQVSETKFTIKAEKERQVFIFDTAIVFARRVSPEQAEFKYEFKSKITLSSVQQVNEFVDGDPLKFTLVTTDHRLHLKAPSVEVKQIAVQAVRTALLYNNPKELISQISNSSPARSSKSKLPMSMSVDRVSSDLMNPSPRPSPPLHRRANGTVVGLVTPAMNGFDKFKVSKDYSSSGWQPFVLKKGEVVEVLDNKIEERWFVRTLSSTPEAGWVPSEVLQTVEGEEDTDGKNKTTITSDVLGGDKLQKFRSQSSFGLHDIQSHQVISTLKKITLQDDRGEEVGEEEEVGEGDITSLDKPSPRTPRTPRHLLPHQQSSLRSEEELQPPPSVSVDPSMLSPTHTMANGGGGTSSDDPTLLSSARSTSWNNRRTRKARYGKNRGKNRPGSMSSDRSESPPEKMASGSSEESIQGGESPATVVEVDPETARKAREKIKHIIAEILQTEQDYVGKLDMCINGYMKAMQSEDLPGILHNKERLIFGNIQAVHDFHSSHFLVNLQLAGNDVEAVGKCFLDHAAGFEVYITYCENKPKSESFIWTYLHTEGTFFEEVQKRLKHRQGIDSFLIKPVQRISQYQLLLRDLQKTAHKSGQVSTPQLDVALQQMQDVPKRANDAMTLSMICGYEGAISATGQLIMHDEFTVYERSRWTGANRHLFLMDQRLIFTKEKDADGLYVYKDSLKVHSLSIVEKQDDNPSRFAVGTGPINSWDQYFILEASSPEKKQVWVDAIKAILKHQFELLKALKQPTQNARQRSHTLGPTTTQDQINSVAHINLSDDSEDEGAEEGDQLTPFSPATWGGRGAGAGNQRRQTSAGLKTLTVGESTANTFTFKPRPLDLYVVAEDCAPSKENEGILFVHKGQVYDVVNKSSDWWFARLARDTSVDGVIGRQGWVPSSFLDKFTLSLSPDEEMAYMRTIHSVQQTKTKSTTLPATHTQSSSSVYSGKQRLKSPKAKHKRQKITSSFMEDVGEEQQQEPLHGKTEGTHHRRKKSQTAKAPQIISHLTDETVIVSRTVRFRCKISQSHPEPTMEWSQDSSLIYHDRAFASLGDENCLLRMQNVTQEDEGLYTCTVCNEAGSCTSTARLTVIGPPSAPGKPVVKPVTSTSVHISWDPPSHTGHSPITLYLIECKDTLSGRWSTLMQRITECSTVMDDLMPGTQYVFRVIAGNQIGSSQPSDESDPVQMARSMVGSEFSLETFHDHYKLLNIIARGQFSEIWECLHCSTQQSYVAKLIPLSSGEHAHHELKMLTRLSHSNMVCVSATYQTDKNYIFLFQLLRGLNLFEHVTVMDHLSEPVAAFFMEQLLSALEYLHNLNIVHLAIKPENVMVVKPASELPVVKLLHFSRAQEVAPGASLTIQPNLNHMEFEAPELLRGEPVSTATDMWSLGVLLYTFIGGTSPFLVDSLDLTKDNICSGRYTFPTKHFRAVSERGRELISGLLVGEQSARLTASQCLQHSWTRQLSPPDTHTTTHTSPSLDLSHLKSYVSTRKWQTTFTVSTATEH